MATYTINNTTLTFNKIYFVDSSKSTSGNGTEASPFNTLAAAVSASSSGDAIVLKGVYAIGQGYVFKTGVSFIGYGAATILRGSQITADNLSMYRMVIDASGYAETFCIKGTNLNLYNVAYVNSTSGDSTREIFAGYVGTFRNCLFQGTQNTIATSTYTPSSSYNNALSCGSLAFTSNVTTSLSNVTYNNVYRITSGGFVDAGTGNDPDGSTADIGLYGGAFAWTETYLDTKPATGGNLRTRISDMAVGDFIRCSYKASNGLAGNFYGLGESFASTELTNLTNTTPDGHFYFVKVSPTLVIADREIQTSITWNALNNVGYAKGTIFNDSLIHPLTSNTSASALNGVASASSIYSVNDDAFKAFDRKTTNSDEWATANNSTTGWIGYEFNEPKLIQRYTMRIKPTVTTTAPIRWALEAWDGSNWVVLHSASYSNWVTDEERTFSFYNTFMYRKYRLNVLQNNGATFVSLNELRMCTDLEESTIRCIRGGRGYMGNDGYVSLTDVGRGVFPVNNEWDMYLTRSPYPDKNGVWHYYDSTLGCWCQETDVSNPMAMTVRGKGGGSTVRRDAIVYTNTASFRPVLDIPQQ